MLTALVNGQREYPEIGCNGICPVCGEEVIPVLGTVNVHHWRHRSLSDCIMTKEESAWHRYFKSLFDINYVEVKKGDHIADVLLPNGTCIEFQNSTITEEEIISSNNNYDRVIWVFNIARQAINGQVAQLYDEEYNINELIYYRATRYYLKCMPYLFLASGKGKGLFKVDMAVYRYEFNGKTKFNELIYHATGTIIDNPEDFVKTAIEIDNQYQRIVKPSLIQPILF